MYKFRNSGQLTTQIDELKKEVSALKRERKALFFIALCGVSYAVLQFAPVAAIVLFVVSFFTLLPGRYCQRRVNANISVVLNIEMRLGV